MIAPDSASCSAIREMDEGKWMKGKERALNLDRILVYRLEDTEPRLTRSGAHADLFALLGRIQKKM